LSRAAARPGGALLLWEPAYQRGEANMNYVIYLVGLVVVVGVILSLVGL
jgi:hypothetical protein